MPEQIPKAAPPQVNSDQRLLITVQHFDQNAEPMSILSLDYPHISNAVANSFQLELTEAIGGVVEKFARAKAAVTGEPWPEV